MNSEHTQSLKILIVDDDSYLSDMYSFKFQELGFETKVVQSAEAALSLIEAGVETFDVLLLDLVMPGTDGFEFLATVREKDLLKESTIIALTNQSREQDIEKAESLGARGYIVKASSIPSEVVTAVVEIHNSDDEKIIVKH
jgi:CheY-like chemotaxis protein